MARTVQSLLSDGQSALHEAELTRPDWTLADVISARVVGKVRKRIVGELGWRSSRVDFVAVDRSLTWKLAQAGHPWRAGLSGWFLIRLTIHPRFGFQAEVLDVLVESLTTSTSVERSAAVWKKIEMEGWQTRQRSLTDPGVPAVVAVVTSPHTQGLADFMSTVADETPVRVVEATMSGAQAAASVSEAVRRASVGAGVVILLRGGGAASGMEWADDERVVEAVATTPVPVWTAIGHADDRHLVDEVAYMSFATPTQAAAELRHRIERRDAQIRETALDHERLAAERHAAATAAGAARRLRAVVVVAGILIVGVAVAAYLLGVQ
jgi:exodeoxyribonuclease VII large subunit